MVLHRWLICGLLVLLSCKLLAQDDTASLETQRIAAERFLQVLVKRPRPGTALDRVYGYHVQTETLGKLIADLTAEAQAGGSDAGAKFFLSGLLQLQQGRDANAVQSLELAEPLSNDAMISFHLGRALLQVGKTDAAAEALQRSIDRKPAKTEALAVYTELGRIYQRAQQTQKAIQVWDQLEQAFPGDTRVGEQIARTLADEGQPEEALKRYDKLAIQAQTSGDSKAINFAMEAAELKRKLGRKDEAIADLEALLVKLRPGSWLQGEARRRIEAGLLASGDFSALADYYAKQVQARPDDLDAMMRLGRALMRAGRLVEAETSLTTAAQRAPENVEVRLVLIDVLRAAGKPSELVKQYETLTKLDAENPDYLVQWGNAVLEDPAVSLEKRRQAAAEVWQRLVAARPTDAVTVSQVANLLRRVERTDDAITLFRKAIELAPDQPQYREYLGEYLHQLDRKDEALAVWQSLAENGRRNAESLVRLAEVLSAFNQPDRSIAAFQDAATFDLTLAQRLRFVTLLARSERYDEALTQLDNAELVAETPEEKEQILKQRIAVYSSGGKLAEQITALQATATTTDDFRKLALMNDAAGNSIPALVAIKRALDSSPNDVAVLGIAGELYRKQSRYADSIEVYRKLSEIDLRFRSSYLQRIAELQMQLGKIDEALATVNEIIAAAPGSPASYRLYADFCFRAGRDDAGLESLKRAARIAPRDNDVRNALASALAQRFRTDEALELYWQTFQAADDIDAKSQAVRLLAPLYDRKGELAQLTTRLEQAGRDQSDMRQAATLIAEAYEATGDLGGARETLQPLLVENPRDAELLTRMVRLSEAIGEGDLVLDYQKQLVALADTPENRRRLLMAMIDNGQIDAATAAIEHMRGEIDVTAMVAMIDRAMRSSDFPLALKLCEETLHRHSELWEVRARLAYCLLCNQKDDDYNAASLAAHQILMLELADDTAAISKPEPPQSSRTTNLPAGYVRLADGRIIATRSRPKTGSAYPTLLASRFKLGRYGRYTFSSSNPNLITIDQYFQARDLAVGVLLVIAAKQQRLDQKFQEISKLAELDSSTDPRQMWDAYFADKYRIMFKSQELNSNQLVTDEATDRINRTLMLYGGKDGQTLMTNLVQSRFSMRNSTQSGNPVKQPDEPLAPDVLAALKSYVDKMFEQGTTSTSYYYLAAIQDEFRLSGQTEVAVEISRRIGEGTDLKSLSESMAYFYMVKDYPQAIEKLNLAIEAYESTPPTARPVGVDAAISQYALLLVQHTTDQTKWKELLQFALQTTAQSLQSNVNRAQGATQSTGVVQSGMSVNGLYVQRIIQFPFSSTLFDQSTAMRFNTAVIGIAVDARSAAVIDELAAIRDEAKIASNVDLQLYAGSIHAFACWWGDDLPGAFASIQNLAESFPERTDVQIETARMAAELNRPAEALAALDKIQPLDQATLRTRELAAMNLAVKLGQLDRAKEAARRLFGMKLDSPTQLAMIDQLNRLGMKDLSLALLNRMQRRGAQTDSELLSIAQKFKDSGDTGAAAEVAYQVLKRSFQGRPTAGQSPSMSDSYRRAAIQLLGQLGTLDKIIAQAEQRASAAPHSVALQSELAELYTAAGRKDAAGQQLNKLAKLNPSDPKTLIQLAAQLVKQGQQPEALKKYLEAFKKDPSLIERYGYELQRVATTPALLDQVYQAMLTWDLSQVRSSRLESLLHFPTRSGRSDGMPPHSYYQVISKLLESGPSESIPRLLRAIESTKSAEIRPVIATAIRRLFDDPATYQKIGGFTSTISYSSDGTISGPIAPCLKYMKDDVELTNSVSAAVDAHVKIAEHQATASAIHIALVAATEMPETLAGLVDSLLVKHGQELPVILLREVSQILAERPETMDLTIKLLESADTVADPNRSANGFGYGVDAQLANAYLKAGRREDCIARLMQSFESEKSTDSRSSISINNPGYGESLMLESANKIGAKLTECEAAIEAAIVYQFVLSKPELFEVAALWGGSSNSLELQKRYDSRLVKLSAETAAEYVSRQIRRLKLLSQGREESADKSKSPIGPVFRIGVLVDANKQPTSAVELVCRLVKPDEAGQLLLKQWDAQLSQPIAGASTPDKLHLAAARAIMALAIAPETAEQRFIELQSLLPADSVWTERTLPMKAADVLELKSVAVAGLGSSDQQVVDVADQLAASLSQVATRQVDTRTIELLSTARIKAGKTIEGIGSLIELLSRSVDQLAPASEQPTALEAKRATELLRLAQSASDLGDVKLSREAVRRALGGGPPLAVVASIQSTGGAFLATPSGRTSSVFSSASPAEPPADLQAITKQTIQIARSWTKAVAQDVDAWETLADVVLPPSRPGEVFPYYVNLVGQGTPQSKPIDNEPSSSIAMLMTELAQASGKADQLRERIAASRRSLSDIAATTFTTAIVLDSILLQLAMQSQDSVAVESALQAMQTSIGDNLPALDAIAASTAKASVNAALARANPPNALTQSLLQSLLPLTLKPEAAGKADGFARADELFLQTLMLAINLNDRVLVSLTRYQFVAAIDEITPRLAARNQRELLKDAINLELAVLIAPYQSSSGDYRADSIRSQQSDVLRQFIKFGFWDEAIALARTALLNGAPPSNSLVASQWSLTMLLLDLAPAARYDALHRFTFGDPLDPNGSEPLCSYDELLLYQTPPKILQSQTPAITKLPQFSIGHPDFPVSHSMLSLIDAGAQCDRLEDLLATLAKRKNQPSDEQDAMIGLIKLAQGKPDEAAEILDQLGPQIAAMKSAASSQKSFPTLTALFAVRCFKQELRTDQSLTLLEDLLVCSQHQFNPVMTNPIRQMLARNGRGPTAGATPDLPLEHWVAVTLHTYLNPESDTFPPLFGIEDRVVRYSGGSNRTMMMLKYPLAGEFVFSHEVENTETGEMHSSFGGVAYSNIDQNHRSTAAGLPYRGTQSYVTEFKPAAQWNRYELRSEQDALTASYNGQDHVTDIIRPAFPFVATVSSTERFATFRGLTITGNPTIPRSVNLLDRWLSGWGTMVYNSDLPDLRLPPSSTMTAAQRQQMLGATSTPNENLDWYVVDDRLRIDVKPNAPEPMRQIEYLRPLLLNETMEYRFRYEPEKAEIHPTIGRTAVLLRRDGVKLRWLAMPRSIESLGCEPEREVTIDESLKPLPLKLNDWNVVRLLADETGVNVFLNDIKVCHVVTTRPENIGLLCDCDRSGDVSDIKLAGPWPETLPNDLMKMSGTR